MFRSMAITLTLCLATITAQASLVGRAPLTPNGTDYQAYYDDVLGITWVADANLARTSGYDADGLMTWVAAQGWIASLNTANYLGRNNWRLPTVADTGTSGCNFAYTGTDCGYNVELATSEMAHLYYATSTAGLGNTGYYNTSGNPTGCPAGPGYCLNNVGPFSNLQAWSYWSGTQYVSTPGRAWSFYFSHGYQDLDFSEGDSLHAWAVLPGDISVVPVSPAVWLFDSALGLMGVMRRKITS